MTFLVSPDSSIIEWCTNPTKNLSEVEFLGYVRVVSLLLFDVFQYFDVVGLLVLLGDHLKIISIIAILL